ncbi:tail completion protein gp17 [Pseudoponticoccus marisrubri]|uniref:DUF3168 domain-containing protein n=1 Tax=Pseudoponticoccus marisrubri TaxID=1685382 RepID=A0A0W7WPB3_9RHOB|nr:DUF3168 domain-containing protein [Pseudoponticoccus marisrubri]KUF12406.1 hypothetical protein AVJ23_01355 [Pseudoponticoccus marisrubri]
MIDPAVSLRTACRAALIATPAVTALVQPDQIRTGSTRPDGLPCVIFATPQLIHLGRAAGGFYASSVALDLHLWALEDGADTAQQIGHAVALALWDQPDAADIQIDEYQRPSFAFMRDPDPERAYCHGIGTVEAVCRWRV